MKSIRKIYEHKGSDTAVFLGSGTSINDITEKQWEAISKTDTWAINNWLYHPFVPKFYHVEVKSYNKALWKRRKREMGKKFRDTVFIINRDRTYLLDVIGKQRYVYGYKMDKINIINKPIVPQYMPNMNNDILTCNLNSSMTLLLELLWRFKYKRVIFFGVDFNDSLYFWTGRPEYGEVHAQWNKDHEGRKPDQPHNTWHIKNFMVWFSKVRMKEVGGQFYTGHKKTLLYPDLEYFNVEEL